MSTARIAMHRLGLPDVERTLARRRAARLLGKPETRLDRTIRRATEEFQGNPEALRLALRLALTPGLP